MAKAFSPTQLNYLNWLNQGNSIFICLEFSTMFGDKSYSTPLTFKADERALHNLRRHGLIQFQDKYELGLRWLVMNISQRGVAALEGMA